MDFIKKYQQILILSCLWLFLILSIIFLLKILLPFVLAIFVAYILNPLISKISKFEIKGKKLPKFTTVLIVYILLGIAVYTFLTIFLPELYLELSKLGKVIGEDLNLYKEAHLLNVTDKLLHYFKYYKFSIGELDLIQLLHSTTTQISDFIRTQLINFISEVQMLAQRIFGFAFNFVLVLMIAGFILIDAKKIRNFFVYLIIPKHRAAFEIFLDKVDSGLSGVIRGQFIICLVNAVLTLIGLITLNIKFALVLASLAGILSIIPIFGSILSTVPIALVALMNSVNTCILAVLWIVIVHALEANILNPKIIGNSAKIHPLLVILALITGEHYYGILGALLAVPTISIISTIFETLLEKAYKY